MSQLLPKQDVQLSKRCLVIYHSNVYDLTDFLPFHPGGKEIILKHKGKDISRLFDTTHNPKTALLMIKYKVGAVQSEPGFFEKCKKLFV